MFQPDPFELAPDARRHLPVAWIVLGAGVLFAAACALPLIAAMQSRSKSEEARIVARDALTRQAAAAAAVRQAQSDPAALARITAEQSLQNQLRMSWTSLFDALETASGEVSGGATVLSLAPVATRADAAEIVITAMATSVPVMLTYVRSLQASPHIREVRLSTQQPTTTGGAAAVRFQLSLLWVPAATSARPAPASPIHGGAPR